MLRTEVTLCCFISLASVAFSQQIALFVPPFQSAAAEAAIGTKVGVILALQIWQTLRVPAEGPGHSSTGLVIWDVISQPPNSYAEANQLAATRIEKPQLVLWGRASRYGSGYVAEAFLSIRGDAGSREIPPLWSVTLDRNTTFSMGVPRQQVDFAPIVLRQDLLPELHDPSGLKLYSSASGGAVQGVVGNYFQAMEHGPDSALVRLPDGQTGWVRLPDLSREHSEVVDFSGAVLRVLRQDWPRAKMLFESALNSPHTPDAVRIDALLYLAAIAHKQGADPYPLVRRAYELNPLARTTIRYLCMTYLATIERVPQSQRQDETAMQARRRLSDVVKSSQSLFSGDDPWFNKLKSYLASAR